jgi:hypothetical protein
MKRLCDAIALAASIATAQATELPRKGDTGTIKGNATACPHRENLERVLHLFDENDGMAAGIATLEGNCASLRRAPSDRPRRPACASL